MARVSLQVTKKKVPGFPGGTVVKNPPANKDADVENGHEDTGRGKGKLGRSERVARTYIDYQM